MVSLEYGMSVDEVHHQGRHVGTPKHAPQNLQEILRHIARQKEPVEVRVIKAHTALLDRRHQHPCRPVKRFFRAGEYRARCALGPQHRRHDPALLGAFAQDQEPCGGMVGCDPRDEFVSRFVLGLVGDHLRPVELAVDVEGGPWHALRVNHDHRMVALEGSLYDAGAEEERNRAVELVVPVRRRRESYDVPRLQAKQRLDEVLGDEKVRFVHDEHAGATTQLRETLHELG